MKFFVVFCVTLVLIGYATGHCCTKCQKSPKREQLKIFYEGEKCDCAGDTFPVHMEKVRLEPSKQLRNYEYEIETVPLPKEPTYGETFNFHKETMNTLPGRELKSHTYDVYSPPDPPPEKPLSPHSYYMETVNPSPRRDPAVLFGHIDRHLLPNEDCDQPEYKKSFPEFEFVKFRPSCKHHRKYYDSDEDFFERDNDDDDECGACGNCPCTCHQKRRQHGRFSFVRYDDDELGDKVNSRKKRNIPTFALQNTKLGIFKSLPLIFSTSGSSNKVSMTKDEAIAASLDPNFVIPDRYDPVMRQEVSSEPDQFTEQAFEDYQHLSNLLSHRTRMDPGYEGGMISPAPARQTQQMIKLLIDLMENKQDVKGYLSPTFENPRDWQQVVDTDDFALKVGHKDFIHVLPVEELDKNPSVTRIDDLQRTLQLPSMKQPKPLYGALDNVATLYQQFKEKSPVPIEKIVAPVYKVLDMYAEKQVAEEKFTENFLKSLKIKRHAMQVPQNLSDSQMSKRVLHDLYERYVEILQEAEEQKAKRKRKKLKKPRKTKKLVKIIENVEKVNKTENTENKAPNFVVLKGDSRVLLGKKSPKINNNKLTDEDTKSEDWSEEEEEFVS